MQKAIIFILLFCNSLLIVGQPEQLIVPISKPGEPGKLVFNNYKGSVEVIGYDGEVVIINATPANTDDSGSSASGLQRLQVNNFQLSAEENNNLVMLNCDCKGKTVNFSIQVPRLFSVQVKAYENATIKIHNIDGVIEADNLNGDIQLANISGSAVVSAIDGNISAKFTKVDSNSPMAFTSIEGDIELVLPQAVNANFKMKTQYGEIFSDFNIEIDKRKAKVKKESEKSVISLDEWTIGKINGGGPEYLIKSYNGDIIIKSGN